MRVVWVILVWIGIVPVLVFHVLEAFGLTNALHYISTTAWRWGDPSLLDLGFMFLSLLTWAWVKRMMNVFLVAAAPFVVGDVWRTVGKRRRGRFYATPGMRPSSARTATLNG